MNRFRKAYAAVLIEVKKILDENDTASRYLFEQLSAAKFGVFVSYIRFKSFDRYFKKFALKGIIMTDENSPQQKAIQYAARQNGVLVFAFQHGNIHRHHPAYIFGAYPQQPVLPDLTFTWGEYFTKFLIAEGGYSSGQLKTNGRIKFTTKEPSLHSEISKDRKVLLFASQPFRNPKRRQEIFRDVLLSAKENSESWQLVVRPHPHERDDPFFAKAAKAVGFTDFVFDPVSDLQSHLQRCDALITAFSTVGSEFIPFYKPLFVIDYLRRDLMGWIADGVGIPIRSQADLTEQLGEKSSIAINREKYDAFVAAYFYRADGKADARALKVINSRLKTAATIDKTV